MNFILQGKTYHAVLRNAADIHAACTLEETHWVATAAPVSAFRLDPEFLRHLDLDQDQRITSGEFKQAVEWTLAILQNPAGVNTGSTDLNPETIRDSHPDGKLIRTLLKRIQGDDPAVSLSKIRKWRTRLESRPVSEAGVVLPEAAGREDVRLLITHLLHVLPGAEHPSGKTGLTEALLNEFLETARERLKWAALANPTSENGHSEVNPLGSDTPKAYDVYLKARDLLDHYFELCDLTTVDPTAVTRFWPGTLASDAGNTCGNVHSALRKLPLARPNPEKTLPLDADVNPAYSDMLQTFRNLLVRPFLQNSEHTLHHRDWARIRSIMERHHSWKTSEPGVHLAPLGLARLQEIVNSPLLGDIRELIHGQVHAAVDLNQVRLAEKLALYQGQLLPFANNFISFPFLYNPGQRAAFEEGSLIMDGRRFNLAVRVPDRAQYVKGAEGGTMFVMIVKLEHPRFPEGLEVAIPATAGRKGNLKVGKHGVFQHVDGTEWFATIVHIIDNPISLSEAVLAPFQRLGAAFSRRVESMTRTAETALDQTGETLMPPAASQPASATQHGQLLAGGGIAIAAMGSSLAFMTKTFSGLTPQQIIGGLFVAIMAVLLPGTMIALLRLNRRDLSVLLEGGGWAVNSRMRLSRAQRLAFTAKPHFPKGSHFIRTRIWWLTRILWITLLLFLIVHLR